MASVAAGLTGRGGASPRRSHIARRHRRAQLVQTELLAWPPLAWLLRLGLPSDRSCSCLTSPGAAVCRLAQPCNTLLCHAGGRQHDLLAQRDQGGAAQAADALLRLQTARHCSMAKACRPQHRQSSKLPPWVAAERATHGSRCPPTSAWQHSGPQSRAWAARPPRRSPGASLRRRDNACSTTFDHPGSGATDAMDGGLSEHAGCPIRSGTKVVLTQWLREAVTAERDWRHYARLDDEETFRNAVSPTRPLSPSPSPSPPPFPSPLPSPQCEQPLTAAEARQTAGAPPAPSLSMRAWVAPPLELGTGAVSHSESLTTRALFQRMK